MSVLLDRFTNDLLPGNDHWPSASDVEVGGAMLKLVASDEQQLILLSKLMNFLETSQGVPTLASALEAHDAELFGFAKVLAFEAYYINPQVREVVARRSIYANRPPQPAGFQITTRKVLPWNEDEILWRSDGTACSNEIMIEQKKDPKKSWTVEEIRQWRL
jgi:hypothetical protein